MQTPCSIHLYLEAALIPIPWLMLAVAGSAHQGHPLLSPLQKMVQVSQGVICFVTEDSLKRALLG